MSSKAGYQKTRGTGLTRFRVIASSFPFLLPSLTCLGSSSRARSSSGNDVSNGLLRELFPVPRANPFLVQLLRDAVSCHAVSTHLPNPLDHSPLCVELMRRMLTPHGSVQKRRVYWQTWESPSRKGTPCSTSPGRCATCWSPTDTAGSP